METRHGMKYRQLHIEDYLGEIPAEQGRGTGVYAHEWITGNPDTNTDFWTDNLLDAILRSDNLNAAYKRVKSNRGTGGIDRMQVDELLPYLRNHRDELIRQLREGKYKPNPVRRVEIPKEGKDKVRKLGIPTVVDRMIQQAIAQELTAVYEEQFSENSYGFRPGRSAHDALEKCREYVNEGYIYAISMDLQAYFDTVNHSKLIEVLSRTIKDGRVISLIHKYLKAGVMEDGGFHATSEGVPQGGPLSPLCGNVMLNELDKELERRGHKFVRYADDCIVLCKSRKSAERTLKHIIPYITKKLYHLENDNPVPLGISPLLEMFVITNRMDNNGAIYMFDDETMQRVAGKLGGNLIILPASVHETIVYSEESGMDIRRSKDMVEAVNQTNLREEEILSGEIYRYDKGNHTLSKVQVPEHEEILMPDKVSMEEMHAYGYTWDAMLPLTKERALELIDTDLLLFRLYEDGAEGMIDSKEEILSHDGLFGVERDSWISYLNTQNQNETNGMTQEM